jgi:hypothetical protein
MLPDVMSDHVTDAAKRLGCQFTETVFYRYALEVGYGQRAEDKARELDTIWKRKGYQALPDGFKDFVLKVCNGERSEYSERKGR